MRRVLWFALGAATALLVALVVALLRSGRVELVAGPEPGSPARERWAVELAFERELLRAPAVLSEPAAREERGSAPRASSGRPRLVPQVRPSTPPRPLARLDGPEAVDYHANGELHFRSKQVRDAEGSWVREGTWRAWHENGRLHEEGAYLAGREHGDWRWWYPDGTPMAEGRFVDGERVGPWTFWYENGSRMMVGQYEDGVGVGRWVHYHENGRKKAEGDFRAGEPAGEWYVWLEDGSLDPERSGIYLDGALVRPEER